MQFITRDMEICQKRKYILIDIFASVIVWVLFFLYRVFVLELNFYPPNIYFWTLLCFYPLGWSFLHYLSGYYNKPYKKSRLQEFFTTFITTLIGCMFLFFVLLLDDPLDSMDWHKKSIGVLFFLQFTFTYIFRLIITTIVTKRIHRREIGYKTLVIGTGNRAKRFFSELKRMPQSLGYVIDGFIYIGGKKAVPRPMICGLKSDLSLLLKERQIDTIVLASEEISVEVLNEWLPMLYSYRINILLLPEMYEVLMRGVKIDTIHGTPLIDLACCPMPQWQQNVKRLSDFCFSAIALLLLSPVFLIIAFLVKKSSRGPIFYKQKRVGRYGELFTIYKFRSMYLNEENNKLVVDNDSRITPLGKILRKYRIDELPQLWNILKGDMSLVGPRPEQPYFVKQIVKIDPHYQLLFRLKPGLTSWGMVKYGYANNIQRMVERAKYDHLYMGNMNLLIDIKIIIYTIKTVLSGRGQ